MRYLETSSCFIVLLMTSRLSLAKRRNETVQPDQLNKLLENGEYEEFGRIVQMNSKIAGPPSNIAMVPFFYIEEYSDVMMRPVQVQSRFPKVSANGIIVSKWKKFVPYAILPYLYTAAQVSEIQDAIRDWNERFRGYIEFRPQTKRDKHYVAIFRGNGCFTNHGRVGGIQAIVLDFVDCVGKMQILHKFMHTIGFGHTNQRTDRDLHIRNHPQFFPFGASGIYGSIAPSVNDTDLEVVGIYGPFEYKSIMMAPAYITGLEPFPLYSLLHRDLDGTEVNLRMEVGKLKAFTSNDELMVRNMYPPS